MKNILLILFLLCFTGIFEASANHLEGGEITWQCIKTGANAGKFKFQVKLYRDCNGPTPPTDVTLTTNAPGVGGGIFCNQVSLIDITPLGVGCPTCANPGGLANAAQEIIYESAFINITGVPPATGWFFWWNLCCRNGAITNLQNPAGFGMTLRAVMYPFNAQNTNPCYDSSPTFAERPQLSTCARNRTSYSHNAIDGELDSLVYSWANPIDGPYPGTNLLFAPNYSVTSPMPGLSQNPLNVPVTLDPSTGVVDFTSFTPGAFVSVTKVSSYKCGILVAEVFREIQIVLFSNCIISGTGAGTIYNTPPTLQFTNPPPPAPVQTPSSMLPYVDTVFAGDTVQFGVVAFDFENLPNGNIQTLTFTASGNEFGANFNNENTGCIIPPCAVLDVPIPQVVPIQGGFNFKWRTTCDHLGGDIPGTCVRLTAVYNFVIKVYDNFCPSNAVNFNTITIIVKSPPPVPPPLMKCAAVRNDGTVDVSWIPPSDTGVVDTLKYFKMFYLWKSTASRFGPYSVIDSVNAITTTTLHDPNANANAGPVHYYMTTRSGCDIQQSGSSDTISTMHLQVTQPVASVFAQLIWTPLFDRADWAKTEILADRNFMKSSERKYQVWRESLPRGSGAWNYVATTTVPFYLDSIKVCDDTINYRITVSDTSAGFGCLSISNIGFSRLQSTIPNVKGPSLRCVSVIQPTGDVQLSWVGSTDTASYFSKYYIYQSTNFAGPYTKIDSVSSFALNTYTDVGANGNNVINYYYLTTKAGCDSISSKEEVVVTSDTLASIIVNATPSLGFATLNWNAQRNPLLGTSTGTYSIYRNIPPSLAWTLQGTSTLTTFKDTIVLCDTLINYRVEIGDNSGCISVSSVDADRFTSLGDILANPKLSCLAVQTNGDIQITWSNPSDPFNFFGGYEIYHASSIAGPYTLITTVPTFATTSYLHVGANGNSQAQYYYLKTLSGCTGIATNGSTSDTLASMFLTATPSFGFADLSWNAMHIPKLATANGAYRVMRRSTGIGAYIQIGTTNNLTFRDTIIQCNVPLEYRIELDDALPCTSISNAINNTFTSLGNVIDHPALQCVNVLPNGNITITWTPPTPASFTDFNEYEIWRNDGTGWNLIDSVANSATLTYSDLTSLGNTQAYTYYVTTQSGCTGQVNSAVTSDSIRSIFLTVSNATLGFANLSWSVQHTPSLGNAPGPYRILRRTTGVGAYTQIGTSATTTYQDVITQCNVPYEYTVVLDNTSGCINTSNAANATFTYVGNVIDHPILQCANVQPNGNIIITWTLPTPASFTDFNEYEIWRNSGAGWNLIDSVSSSGTPTYTDLTALGNTQAYTYYVTTQSGCTGQVYSPTTSDSIQSIFLTVSNATLGFANLSWNVQHIPSLGNAPGPYRILRRTTGVGAYSQIGTSATTTYQDVITQCNVPYEYTVVLDNTSGCINTSNAANATFTYVGNVIDHPLLQCANVQPNGNIIITWTLPTPASFTDFNEYEIWRNSGAGWSLIDSVSSSGTPTYTDLTALGNTQAYTYYVTTQSGCTGQVYSPTTSDSIRSIFLTVSNATLGFANLSWNVQHIPSLGNAPGPYRILRRTTGVGAYSQIGTSVTTTYQDVITQCNVPYEYTVVLDNTSGCINTSNAANATFTYLGNVIDHPVLNCANVNANGSINLTYALPTPVSFTDFNEYEIWRNAGSGWTLIDSVQNSGTTSYLDLTANGNTQSYTYYITTQSGCTGQVYSASTSDSISSLYLTVSNANLGFADLSWNAQHIPALTTAPGPYLIMRRLVGNIAFSQIGTSSTTTFRDTIKSCSVPYEYNIILNNSTGCYNTSNTAGDVFTYIGNVISDPRLRCVSVLPTGEIELNWEGPSSTNFTDFNEYEIWRNNGTGFALYDSIKSSTTYYFKDKFSNGNAQSYSYYLITQSGCTGQVTDGTTSDTIASMYLQTTPSLGLATIDWNALHNPLPSGEEYRIFSTYNVNSALQQYGDTLQLQYFQSIINCDTLITHQIKVNDPSGCVSNSNLATKSYTYIGNVIDNPELRCLNVNANGTIQLTWKNPVPSSWVNFNQYNLYRNNGSGLTLIDSISPFSTGTYTDINANGNAGSVSYYLQTKSGCTGQVDNGTNGNSLSSIYLKVTGAGNTVANLNWNALSTPNLPTSTGLYSVDREFPGGSGNWITLASNIAVTNYSQVLDSICIDSVNYRVRIQDLLICESGSNIDGEIFIDNRIPAAPQLTCASVQLNGDVVLTWIAPTDTAHQFNSYQIYSSNNINGPYNPVDSVFTYATTTKTIVGANAQVAPVYYSIKTRSGCGVQYSPGSDTLKTIAVKVLNNNGVALISWNPINTALVTPSTTYDLFKEYPLGTWSKLVTLIGPVYQYADTINVCDAFINYRVTENTTGCVANSSIDGDRFRDLTKPYAALLDTVSLDPASPSNISISWLPSTSGDAQGYILYLFNGASWDSIGAVAGRNNTSFQHINAAAANAPQLYSIASYDSCRNVSNIGISHNTMFLTAKLDICRAAIDIRWNPYINMVAGVGNYNVYVSTDGSPFSLLATVPSNNISYSHTTLIKGSTYCYYVEAQGNLATRTSRSTSACEYANLLTEPVFSYLKKATVADVRKVFVECLVDTANDPDVSRYKLQRSTERNGPFTTVGITGYTGDPIVGFTDYTARTNEYSYFYRVITIDSCGNEVLISNLGRTMLLSGRGEYNLTNRLFWNDYEEWLGSVKSYSVFRKVDDLWETIPVSTNIGFGFTQFIDDVSANYLNNSGRFCYRIEAYESNGNPYGYTDTSVSNEFCLIQEPHLFMPNAFTPGGKNPILKPQHIYYDTKGYFFAIFNRWGQKVFESNDPQTGWDGLYQGKLAPAGTYVYSVRIYGTNGQEIEKNGTVTLLK